MVYKICLIAVSFAAACGPTPAPQNEGVALPKGAAVSQSTQKEPKMSKPVSSTANTARNGQIAIKEEFDAAMQSGTKAALEFFIKRHPNSQWTPEARAKLRRLQ